MKNIAAALLKVQQGLDPVHKGKKGYGYSYADLPAVMASCLDSLNDNGILLVQAPTRCEKQAAAIETRLIHAETGEEISGVVEVPWAVGGTKMSDAQAYGSAMTYAKRYALVSMLGIVTEDDDAAKTGNAPKAAPKQQEAVKPAQVAAPKQPEKAKTELSTEQRTKINAAVTALGVMDEAGKLQWLATPANFTMVKWLKDNAHPLYAEFKALGVEVAA